MSNFFVNECEQKAKKFLKVIIGHIKVSAINISLFFSAMFALLSYGLFV
jgi:hypothetical protein